MDNGSASHLSLLFAFLYAKTERRDLQGLIDNFLTATGEHMDSIIDKHGYIRIKFISIKEILDDLRAIQLYVDVAA